MKSLLLFESFSLDEYEKNFYRDNTIEAAKSNFSINNNNEPAHLH